MKGSPLRSFIQRLEQRNLVAHVQKQVDPYLEIAEIHRCVQAANGPALLFHNVKNSSFPVVTGLFGSEERVELAFDSKPEVWIQETMNLLMEGNFSLNHLWKKRTLLTPLLHLGKKRGFSKGVLQCEMETNLEKLPLLQLWPEDGGHFFTLPLVYTQGSTSENLGIYRMQRFDQTTMGLHFQISKGGGFHYFEAEQSQQNLPVTVFLGGPVEWILGALAPLPENISEWLFISYLMRRKVRYKHVKEHPHPMFTDAEFAITGFAKPKERKLEGPFGDHYGFYSLAHPFPVFHAKKIYHRENPIFPAMVVGKPNQEDAFLGNYLQKLLKPLIKMTMPLIEDLWTYSACGFHNLASAIVKDRYTKEPLQAAFRILGEGQLSLTKTLMLIDENVDLMDFTETLMALLSRLTPESVYLLRKTAADTLDYSDEKLNEGSKVVLIGTGPKQRTLNSVLPKRISGMKTMDLFCPGVLVVEMEKEADLRKLFALKDHPFIFVVDDVEKTVKDETSFLWTAFTQFDPAKDLLIEKELPLIFDSRKKPHFPKEVLSSKSMKEKVATHWKSYFETKVESKEPDQAHVY